MENTSPLLFDNIDEKYFLASQGRAQGPLTAQELYERVQRGDATLLHFVWREGQSDWRRICEEKEFAVLIPQKPPTEGIRQIQAKLEGKRALKAPAPAPAALPRQYYLYFGGSQYGPFSQEELLKVLRGRKLDRNAYLWMPSWPNWKRMCELEEFKSYFPETDDAPAVLPAKEKKSAKRAAKPSKTTKKAKKSGTRSKLSASEKREAPRRPLVARLFLHNDKDVIVAVCRDISVGGMQVLTDRVPGNVGSRIKLNVSPAGGSESVKSFVAEGEIVRVLEDGRGFSFRFTKISEETRKAIEQYIRLPGSP